MPAAVAVAALVGADAGRDWLAVARRFMLPSLVLLAVGMAAGAHWAYVELGWGGYWAWDPVENGALLPWLAGVAFLHSALVAAERRPADPAASPSTRGRLRPTVRAAAPSAHGLAFLAFGLSLLGAFLTRSGVTASVHAFAEARAVGRVLLATLAVTSVALVGLMVVRRRRGGRRSRSTALTRAGAVRANNALLLAVIVVVGFGLLYPVAGGRRPGRHRPLLRGGHRPARPGRARRHRRRPPPRLAAPAVARAAGPPAPGLVGGGRPGWRPPSPSTTAGPSPWP